MSELDTGALGPGRIETRELEQEMRSSFLDYAMSVIVARALPDVRDGLKPVHRRVLYGMHEAGMQPGRPHKKCARIVGDVMGSYHPHGDAAIYDTLVRLAQSFSMRYPLVDGQGNFGNVDGYPAASMRYTEVRLARMATELLRDIDADTVDFGPNYDESRKEPQVLPSRDRRQRASVRGEERRRRGRDRQDGGARQDGNAHRDLPPPRSLRQVRHADRDRAEARRGASGRPEQALQAHVAADHVRLQRR